MSTAEVRSITASDGRSLKFRYWAPEERAIGTVVAVHGIQSHSGWYEYSSRKLAEAGLAVYFADRRGSGQNGRPRGHADHGMRLLNDVRQLVRLAAREHSSADITLLGLSWGGKIASAFAATYPQLIQRLVLLYPGLVPLTQLTRWQRFRLWFARTHDIRFHPVAIPLRDPRLFTNSREGQTFIENDPLALEYVTSGLLNAGTDLDRIIAQQPQAIVHPTLLMLAGSDRIINNAATEHVVKQFGSKTLDIITYPDAAHTLEFDDCRDQFVSDLTHWLTTSSESPAPAASR